MDPRVRLIAATAVMLVGLSVALCFRRGSAEAELTIPASRDALISGPTAARNMAAVPLPLPPPAPRRMVTLAPPRIAATVVTPSDQPAPPPEFSKSFPEEGPMAGGGWGASMAEKLSPHTASPPMHRIVDGDTLERLAQRYLGSPSRAMEIYQANRNVLTTPDILPIDTVIRIPRPDQAAK